MKWKRDADGDYSSGDFHISHTCAGARWSLIVVFDSGRITQYYRVIGFYDTLAEAKVGAERHAQQAALFGARPVVLK